MVCRGQLGITTVNNIHKFLSPFDSCVERIYHYLESNSYNTRVNNRVSVFNSIFTTNYNLHFTVSYVRKKTFKKAFHA